MEEGNNVSLEHFLNQALSSWMNVEGPDSDIVLSSRIRLARNLDQYNFLFFQMKKPVKIIQTIKNRVNEGSLLKMGEMDLLIMDNISLFKKES